MEDFQIRCQIMDEVKDKEEKKILKERTRVIAKRIKSNPILYKSLLE